MNRLPRVAALVVTTLVLSTQSGMAIAAGSTSHPSTSHPSTSHVSAHLVPSTVHVGSVFVVSGATTPKIKSSTVVVERLVGKAWKPLGHTKTTAAGAYALNVRAPKTAVRWAIRVVRGASAKAKAGASAVVHETITKALYVVTASGAATVTAPGPVMVSGSVAPKATGVVELQLLQGSTWHNLAAAHLTAASGFAFSLVRPVGSYRLRVVKAFSAKVAGGTSSTVTVTVAPPPPVVTTTSLAAGMVARPYTQALSADSGLPPYSWTSTGLPAGLTLSSSGTISGTPALAATSTIGLTVTDSAGRTGSVSLPLTIAVTSGTVVAWGTNVNGELGNNTSMDSLTPTPVQGLTQVTQVAGGNHSGYALRADGTVWAWGANPEGELGNNTTTNGLVPVQVSGLTGITAVVGGFETGYALKSDGTVWAWGGGAQHQLGNNTVANALVPVQVSGLTNVRAIAGSGDDGYAVKSDGTVWVWGSSLHGALGDGQTATSAPVPVQVPGLTTATGISAASGVVYVLMAFGYVEAWGYDGFGAVGNGTHTGDVTSPTQLTGLSGVVAVSAGLGDGYALRSDGTVYGWGVNDAGELGTGLVTTTYLPTLVPNLTGVKAIGAHGYSMTALTTAGSLVVWGDDSFHGLGTPALANAYTAVALTGLPTALFVPPAMYGTDGYAVVAQ